MEKVIVIKRIPGILEIGDTLISDSFGEDFILEKKETTRTGSKERYVNLDYETVCGNIPHYFDFVIEEDEYQDIDFKIVRTDEDIKKRYNYFINKMNAASTGSEQDVIYHNLVWFIEWLTGIKELYRI